MILAEMKDTAEVSWCWKQADDPGAEKKVPSRGGVFRNSDQYSKKLLRRILGTKVDDAVVTVPAYFNESQRCHLHFLVQRW